MDLDLALCAAILSTGSVTEALNSGIGVSQLQGVGALAFEEITRHYRTYGVLPDRDVLLTQYPALNEAMTSLPKNQPIRYFTDGVKDRWLMSLTIDTLKQVSATVGKRQPEKALELMKDLLSRTREWRRKYTNSSEFISDAEDRILWYMKTVDFAGGVDGIAWPWGFLNTETQGVHGGEFYVFPGLVGTGKTWMLIECLHSIVTQGLEALIISMELPLRQIWRRFDSRYLNIPYDSLKKAMLGTEGFERYAAALRDYKNSLPKIWAYGRPTVNSTMDVELLIQEHKPAILLIDSLYLLREASTEARFVQTIEAVELIKPLALTHDIGVIGTTQFKFDQKTAGRVRQGRGEMEDMGYAGGALSAIADGVYGLFAPEEMRRHKKRVTRILKRRESADDGAEGFVINWDFDRMDFSEIGIWKDGAVVRHDSGTAAAAVPF